MKPSERAHRFESRDAWKQRIPGRAALGFLATSIGIGIGAAAIQVYLLQRFDPKLSARSAFEIETLIVVAFSVAATLAFFAATWAIGCAMRRATPSASVGAVLGGIQGSSIVLLGWGVALGFPIVQVAAVPVALAFVGAITAETRRAQA